MFENKKEKSNRTNPFFENYNTPHETVPFSLIEISDYEEAFMEGIRRDDEEIEKIINDESEPTFENTIIRTDNEKGEHYYDLLFVSKNKCGGAFWDKISKIMPNNQRTLNI